MKQITVTDKNQIKKACEWAFYWLGKGLEGGKNVNIKLSHESRTDAQNRHLWPLCECIAKQCDYPLGSGLMRDKEQWKILFVSAYRYDPSLIMPGINGELVNIGYSSSALPKPQFSELIEFIYAYGCERGIEWNKLALDIYEEWSKQ